MGTKSGSNSKINNKKVHLFADMDQSKMKAFSIKLKDLKVKKSETSSESLSVGSVVSNTKPKMQSQSMRNLDRKVSRSVSNSPIKKGTQGSFIGNQILTGRFQANKHSPGSLL